MFVARHPTPPLLPGLMGKALAVCVTSVAPTFVAFMGIAIVGNLAQVGFILTGKPLKPKMSNMNPVEGFKRMFSTKSLWQLAAETMRLGIIVAVVYTMIHGVANELINAASKSPGRRGHAARPDVAHPVRTIAAVCVLIGFGDYAMKRRDLMRKLRMSKQEVRQEMKDAEGDPHVRARMRSMRMSMTRNRMLNAIATADVVVTNPTHIAIAISYSREQGAPRVVARGAGSLAEKIRAEADRHDMPRVEAKPLARTLYRLCRPGGGDPRRRCTRRSPPCWRSSTASAKSRRSFAGRLSSTWPTAGRPRRLRARARVAEGPGPCPQAAGRRHRRPAHHLTSPVLWGEPEHRVPFHPTERVVWPSHQPSTGR